MKGRHWKTRLPRETVTPDQCETIKMYLNLEINLYMGLKAYATSFKNFSVGDSRGRYWQPVRI